MIGPLPNPLIVPVGLAIGVLIAAPVGPVNVVCIQRAIKRGVLAGMAAGLGAVLGDGLIALLAALGVGAISGFVNKYHAIIQCVGGIVLVAFGLRLYSSHPHVEDHDATDENGYSLADCLWDVPKTFFLTITNPGAVLGLIAIFGGISSFVAIKGPVEALILVASIMAGSCAWWLALSMLMGRIRHAIDDRRLELINRSAAVLLVGFGVMMLGELIFSSIIRA